MKRLFLLLFFAPLFGMAQSPAKLMTAEEYIAKYKDLAISEMKRTGIPASITLGQGLQESGNGNSKLTREAKNHFGIKGGGDWTGKCYNMDDDAPQECFRIYATDSESYHDHSEFLMGRKRYADLFQLDPKDYKGWAKGLKKDGYATKPTYAEELIQRIEKYRLYELDTDNPGNLALAAGGDTSATRKVKRSHSEKTATSPAGPDVLFNGILAYEVHNGDSYASIADGHSMMRWQIRKYNDLNSSDVLEPGTLIYLKPKHRKGLKSHEYHIVKDGESMYYIAQLEGIKLKRLYKLNHLHPKDEAAAGEKLYLRRKSPEAPKLASSGYQVPKKGYRPEPPAQPASAPKPDGNPVKPLVAQNAAPAKTAFIDSTAKITSNAAQASAPLLKTAGVKANDSSRFYIVGQGEGLFAISQKTGVALDSLKKYNGLTGFSVNVGQRLYLRETDPNLTKKVADTSANSAIPEFHEVGPKETLYSISRKYSISVDRIKELNGLPDNSLSIGQKLKLK
jgi:LysM repeat protein